MSKIDFGKILLSSSFLVLAPSCDKKTSESTKPVAQEEQKTLKVEAKKDSKKPSEKLAVSKEVKISSNKISANTTSKEIPKPIIKTDKSLNLKEVLMFESQVSLYKTIAVPFKEDLYRQLRKKTLHKEGFAYFVRPNKFIWQVGSVGSKAKQYWIYNGKELIQKSSEDKQVARFDSKVSKSQELNRLVGYFVNFKDLFATHNLVSAVEKQEGLLNILLRTKAQTNIDYIDAVLSIKKEKQKKFVLLKHMKISYRDKNHTSFSFGEFTESLPKPAPLSEDVLDFLK